MANENCEILIPSVSDSICENGFKKLATANYGTGVILQTKGKVVEQDIFSNIKFYLIALPWFKYEEIDELEDGTLVFQLSKRDRTCLHIVDSLSKFDWLPTANISKPSIKVAKEKFQQTFLSMDNKQKLDNLIRDKFIESLEAKPRTITEKQIIHLTPEKKVIYV